MSHHDDMEAAKSSTRPYRFGAFVDGLGWVEHAYGRVWQRESERLIVAPDWGQVELLANLSEGLSGPFRIAYILLVAREQGPDEGRFELAGTMTRDDLQGFLRKYRELFENDGRHHLSITSEDGSMFYDQHNVLYLEGPLKHFVSTLDSAGFTESPVEFPTPHSHHYHVEHDHLVDDMLERYEWRWFPL